MLDRIPTRVSIGVMLLLAMASTCTMRTNMSVNILAMTNADVLNGTGQQLPDFGPRQNWSPYDQSLVLGAFFWGYQLMQIPQGVLIDRFALAYLNVGWSLLVMSLLTLLTPLAAGHSLWMTVCNRFLMGLVSGGFIPSIQNLIAKWAPTREKTRFSLTISGIDLGAVLAWSLSGVCTEMAGWQWSFYGNGSICLAFSLLWFYVVRDSPAQHPRITTTERDWIVGNQTAVQPDARRWPPLTQMLCSGPFWMLVVSHYGHLWGWNFLMTSAPRFIYEVLGFDLSWTGALASATYLTRPVAGVVSAAASDGLINGLGLSVAAVRKGMTVVSHVLSGVCLLLIGLVGAGPNAAVWCVTLIIVSTLFNGAAYVTSNLVPQDLAPNFVGSVCAFANMVTSTTGFLTPMLVGYVTERANGMPEWILLFGIAGAVYIVSGGLFIIFGSVEVQPWNNPKPKSRVSKDSSAECSVSMTI